MKISKKNYKVLSYTILVLLITMSSTYNTSHSKFIEQKDYAFVYQNQLMSLLQKDKITMNLDMGKSVKTKAFINFILQRNKYGIGKNDNYILNTSNMDKDCQFYYKDTLISDNTISISDSDSSSEIKMTAVCPVNESGIVLSLIVDEKVNDETVFKYTTYDNVISKKTYDDYFPTVDNEATTLYDVVNNWLEKNYYNTPDVQNNDSSVLIGEIQKYLDSYKNVNIINGKPEKDITNLKGINVQYDNVNNSFKISIEENFIGYAKTYSYISDNKLNNPDKMYFYSNDLSSINSLFDFYLSEYGDYYLGVSKDQVNNAISTVKNYLKLLDELKTDDAYDITKAKNVSGLKWISSLEKNLKILSVKDLYSFAKNYGNYPIKISTNKINYDMYQEYLDSISVFSKSNIVSESLIRLLSSGVDEVDLIDASIVKNNVDIVSKSKFNDYFIIYDEDSNYNNYVIANVYSSSDLQNNIFNLIPIDVSKSSKGSNLVIKDINFTNNGNELAVALKINLGTISDESDKLEKAKQAMEIIDKFCALLESKLKISSPIKNSDNTYGINKDSLVGGDTTNSDINLDFTVIKTS